MIWDYTGKHILRSPAKSLAAVAAVLALMMLQSVLGYEAAAKNAAIEAAYTDMPVTCQVSSTTKASTDSLSIQSAYIVACTGVNGKMTPYVKDVGLKLTLTYLPLEGQTADTDAPAVLIGISLPDAAPDIREGASVTYGQGYDESIWQGEDAVCLVSPTLLETLGLKMGDTLTLDPEAGQVSGIAVPKDRTAALTVVGTVDGENPNAVYCPFGLMETLYPSRGVLLYSECLFFTIKDNRQIPAFKTEAARYFQIVERVRMYNSDRLSLTVYDSSFYTTLKTLRREAWLYETLLPFCYAISFGIGFLVSFLMTRVRKNELAVMRSLGTGKAGVFGTVFLEQALLCIGGIGLGMLLFAICFGTLPDMGLCGIFALSYLLGCGICVYRMTRVNVMAVMMARE